MTDNPVAAKHRIDVALETLRLGLTPFVSQRMASAFGNDWRLRARRAFVDGETWALDVSALLKTILDNWNNVFSADAKLRKARAHIHVTLDARNNVAHFTGSIEQREALRYLDAILELLGAIGATAQRDVVSKLYAQQQAGVMPTGRSTGHALAAVPIVADPATLSTSQAGPGKQADRIRQFAFEQYVCPARQDGRREVTIRAGDVHRQMGLTSAMPAVCSAIGGKQFAELAKATLVNRTGPTNGANVYFQFKLDADPVVSQPTAATRDPVPETVSPPKKNALDLDGALVLVSCVKTKLSRAAPARSLYGGTWFTSVREIVETSSARWFILSSRYGLVTPDAVIAPYEYTLNTLGVADRRTWARHVLDMLLPETADCRRVVMFAGRLYREFLLEPLRQRGITVEVPMENLTRGEQLAWLNKHR
ncbi:MAG TPA: Swt1 family HEPN domain-containing protein [Bryobacteraceae bacterium]|jgi:hypothetical protein